jgi:uncharacterized protein (UPF0332 family)
VSLENLVKTGQLLRHATSREEIGKLLKGAARSLKDAENSTISNASRFTLAYTAIMETAQAALFANGYRSSKSEGGHHMTMIQALVHTISLDAARMRVLDTHRHRRNVVEYSGDEVEASQLQSALAAAKALLSDVKAWLAKNHPELL